MGSGLILLVIVGAWLAVLVPMALRSHEATSLGTVDKFHDAMRVLSRREVAELALDDSEEPPDGRFDDSGEVRSTATRRRRILLALLALAMGTLVAALLGPRWLFAPHLGAGLAFAGYVAYLRAQARRADRESLAARSQRRAEQRAAEAAEVVARARELLAPPVPAVAPSVRRVGRPMRIAGVPDRMPTRVALGATPRPLPVEGAELVADFVADGERVGPGPAATGPAASRPAGAAASRPAGPAAPALTATPADAPATSARPARSDRAARPEGAGQTGRSARTRRAAPVEEQAQPAQPPAARGAQGGAWLPVPVPPPIYLTAPPAPRRRPAPSADDEAAAPQEPAGEDVADDQRAVND